jgi:hypothetical protein
MNEKYRPLKEYEKRMHRLRTEPRGYEHIRIPIFEQQAPPQEEKQGSVWALLLLGLLTLMFGEESGIEGGGKTETPQSTMIAKS